MSEDCDYFEEHTLREHALRFKALMMSELDLRFEKYINDYIRAKEEERDDCYEPDSVFDYIRILRNIAGMAADDVMDELKLIHEKRSQPWLFKKKKDEE